MFIKPKSQPIERTNFYRRLFRLLQLVLPFPIKRYKTPAPQNFIEDNYDESQLFRIKSGDILGEASVIDKRYVAFNVFAAEDDTIVAEINWSGVSRNLATKPAGQGLALQSLFATANYEFTAHPRNFFHYR